MPDINPSPNSAVGPASEEQASLALVGYCFNYGIAGVTPFGNVFDRTPQLQEVIDLEAVADIYTLFYETYYSDYLAILNGYIL